MFIVILKKIIRDALKTEGIENIEPNKFKSPPSLDDLFISFGMNKALGKESGIKINSRAVDHTGVWNFNTLPESEAMELFGRHQELLAEREAFAIEELKRTNTEDAQDKLKTIEELRKKDPRDVAEFLDKLDTEDGQLARQDSGAASRPFRQELDELRKKMNENEDFKWVNDFQKKSHVTKDPADRAAQVEEYVRRCKKIGADITYEPIESFQD